MKERCLNYYKICRENAGFTQIKAAELLNISDRSLSDYENSKTKVPDDIVDNMTRIYEAPLLAWWHIKNTSVLGKYLPNIVTPQTNVDMAFQTILAQDELDPAVKVIKKIMSDGVISDEEKDEFHTSIEMINNVAGKLVSVVAYAKE
ncbi:helix-turn-helix domain-containing protein [Clostridium sp. 'White wine YQ']|uniref:helix-turn-helix domain-containing protein n=1 Tax=Clostridium sp. 'White wine YQ' TaxID=3027474 RepID=UPI0023670132|nr:helix-turn-helix transcriptional regulator [Clostridium sp. 'White wine YQ']MDD7793665.1 helix-turn-helix transcriptional regulator [Clostridium sp. 'White wine YQ']